MPALQHDETRADGTRRNRAAPLVAAGDGYFQGSELDKFDLTQPRVKLITPQVRLSNNENTRQRSTTAKHLRDRLIDFEHERAPRLGLRKFHNLAVNAWNLCAAKRTNYTAHGGMDAPVKLKILQFLGDVPPDQNLPWEFSASHLRVVTEGQRNMKICKMIETILKECKTQALKGHHGCDLVFRDHCETFIARTNYEGPNAPWNRGKRQYWACLFESLPELRDRIAEAGFTIRTPSKNLPRELNSELHLYWLPHGQEPPDTNSGSEDEQVGRAAAPVGRAAAPVAQAARQVADQHASSDESASESSHSEARRAHRNEHQRRHVQPRTRTFYPRDEDHRRPHQPPQPAVLRERERGPRQRHQPE